MSRPIRITIEGEQGSGKTRALDTLRAAGWTVSEEQTVGLGNTVVRVVATPPALGRGMKAR